MRPAAGRDNWPIDAAAGRRNDHLGDQCSGPMRPPIAMITSVSVVTDAGRVRGHRAWPDRRVAGALSCIVVR